MRLLFKLLLCFIVIVFSTKSYAQFSTSDLYYTCKIWGFLKYHHPSVTSGKYNWDNELFMLLDQLKGIKSEDERNALFLTLVNKLGDPKKQKKLIIEDSTQYTQYPNHTWIQTDKLGLELSSQLEALITADRGKKSHYIKTERYNNKSVFINELQYNIDFNDSNRDKLVLLSLFRFWNAFAYFAPYTYLTDKDWDDVLKESIPQFCAVSNHTNYRKALSRLIAQCCDSHARMKDKSMPMSRKCFVPVVLQLIEDQVVVTRYFRDMYKNCGLEQGDIILEKEGVSVHHLMDSTKNYRSMSNKGFGYNVDVLLWMLSAETEQETIAVKCVRGGDTLTVNAKTSKKLEFFIDEDITDKTKIIDNDILYLYMRNIYTKKSVDSIMTCAKKYKALILDLREGLQVMPYKFAEHLYSKPAIFGKDSRVNPLYPGYTKMNDGPVAGKVNPNCYKGQVVILVNHQTISSAEFSTMIFQQVPGSIVVGSQTAGADGNWTPIDLPGGMQAYFTGVGVYYPDGGEAQRVGVRIDEIVKPTIKGIREGRDELLERAIKIIKEKK